MNTKRLIVSLLMSLMIFTSFTISVMAEDVETCVEVTQYGGGVGIVCGAKHEAVDTGLADINPLVLSSIFVSLSIFGAYLYKKSLKSNIEMIEVGGGDNK